MTASRCPTYWRLMTARDKATADLEAIKAAHPNGGGSESIRIAGEIVTTAIAKQTAHLHECPVCGKWMAETKELAERPGKEEEE